MFEELAFHDHDGLGNFILFVLCFFIICSKLMCFFFVNFQKLKVPLERRTCSRETAERILFFFLLCDSA